MLESGVRELVGEVAVVGEQEQSGGVRVQPARGVQPQLFVSFRQDIQDGAPAFFVAGGGNSAGGFVEHQADRLVRFEVDRFPVDGYTVALDVHRLVERFGGPAVDLYFPLFDGLRHAASRAGAGFGEGFY